VAVPQVAGDCDPSEIKSCGYDAGAYVSIANYENDKDQCYQAIVRFNRCVGDDCA
jgi:hypothetical protein